MEPVQSAATAVMALNLMQWQDVGRVNSTQNTQKFYIRCIQIFQA